MAVTALSDVDGSKRDGRWLLAEGNLEVGGGAAVERVSRRMATGRRRNRRTPSAAPPELLRLGIPCSTFCGSLAVRLPTPLHAEAAVRALRAGKPVICEKPLARTSAEGARNAELGMRKAERGTRKARPQRPAKRVVRLRLSRAPSGRRPRPGRLGGLPARKRPPGLELAELAPDAREERLVSPFRYVHPRGPPGRSLPPNAGPPSWSCRNLDHFRFLILDFRFERRGPAIGIRAFKSKIKNPKSKMKTCRVSAPISRLAEPGGET